MWMKLRPVVAVDRRIVLKIRDPVSRIQSLILSIEILDKNLKSGQVLKLLTSRIRN